MKANSSFRVDGSALSKFDENWNSLPLIDIAPLQRGFDLPTRNIVPGNVPVVYSNGIERYHNRAIVKSPGVVTGRSGTIGSVHYVSEDYWPHNTSLWVKSFKNNDPKFIYYLYKHIDLRRFASGSGVPTLNRNDVHTFEVMIPSNSKEQSAIGEALSDADALIESLKHFTEKKRQIKQGAMQELLTGKRRLAGYAEAWLPVTLDQLADIRSGGTPSTNQPEYWDGGVAWCTPTDITALAGKKYLRSTHRSITELGLKCSSAETVPPYSVIMTSRATIGACAINTEAVTTNQGFKNFIPRKGVDVEFLYYLLLTQTDRFIALCGGSTFLEIGKAQLSTFEVVIPNSHDEQIAISELLSEIDAEIDALDDRLIKAQQIKQGMMQELLTGRIRLV